MAEFKETVGTESGATTSGKFKKTWCYTEKTNKHTIYHTISLTKERYTHESEIKEVSHAMRSRTDIRMKDVHSVNTFYGLSRNIGLAVFMWILAAFFLLAGIGSFLGGVAEGGSRGNSSGVAMGIIMVVVAAFFGVIGYSIYRRIKPAFMLEINTVLGPGSVQSDGVSYGSIAAALGANASSKRRGLIRAKNKYKFEMPPEIGHDIIDTIGPLLIDD